MPLLTVTGVFRSSKAVVLSSTFLRLISPWVMEIDRSLASTFLQNLWCYIYICMIYMCIYVYIYVYIYTYVYIY